MNASTFQLILFYAFSAMLVISALSVVIQRNPVYSAVSLVLAFVFASPLWLLTGSEFLALVLVFVYVGAVMTLFLFVVMMLNVGKQKKQSFVQYMPFGTIIVAVLVGLMIYILKPANFALIKTAAILNHPASYSNVAAIGNGLYTTDIYPLELAAVLLLVAIVAAISLAFQGPRDRKTQNISKQVKVKRNDRVRLVNMPAEKK